jgi:hypothetical protein
MLLVFLNKVLVEHSYAVSWKKTYSLNCPGIVNVLACKDGQKCFEMMVG